MELIISSPFGYDPGVYKIAVSLSSDELVSSCREKIYFDIPVISNWFFVIRDEYRFPSLTPAGSLKGVIINGFWEADVQTNGITEEENPIKIDHVEASLLASIEQMLSVFCNNTSH